MQVFLYLYEVLLSEKRKWNKYFYIDSYWYKEGKYIKPVPVNKIASAFHNANQL